MKRFIFAFAGACLSLTAVVTPAAAGDALQAAVTPLAGPAPIVTENGNPYAAGTYAVGTIHLDYTFTGVAFPAGTFATFRLDLASVRLSERGKLPTYPVPVAIENVGSPNLTLSPVLGSMDAQTPPWSGSTDVTVIIPAGLDSDPSLTEDGATIVGKLRLSAPGSHLDTPTDVLVRIRLVHPDACVKMYNFITDTTLATIYEHVTVHL